MISAGKGHVKGARCRRFKRNSSGIPTLELLIDKRRLQILFCRSRLSASLASVCKLWDEMDRLCSMQAKHRGHQPAAHLRTLPPSRRSLICRDNAVQRIQRKYERRRCQQPGILEGSGDTAVRFLYGRGELKVELATFGASPIAKAYKTVTLHRFHVHTWVTF